MIYNKIYDFCKVRNHGPSTRNGNTELPPRVQFLLNLLDDENIPYELDTFMMPNYGTNNLFYNIILRGTSNRMVVAHHDVCNPTIDNANDNSCSVINAIALKKLRPNIHVVLLDAEEPPALGYGSTHLAQQINNGDFGTIEWVLNFELTGKGGKYFFIGNYPGPLNDRITQLFNCPVTHTPFNDAAILRRYGIDSTVINPCPTFDMVDNDDEDDFEEIEFTEDEIFKLNNNIFDEDLLEKYNKYFDQIMEANNNPKNKRGRFGRDNLVMNGRILDTSMLGNCHSARDSVSSIDPNDMKEFIEEVVLKIVD